MADITASSEVVKYLDLEGLNEYNNTIVSKIDGKANSSHNHSAANITSGTLSSYRLPTVPISKGGTGATTAAAALTNLGLTATATELNYMDGVTSNVQTQLNAKAASSHTHSYLPLSGGTMTGAVTNGTTSGGSWIAGKTDTPKILDLTTASTMDGSRYDPLVRGKNTDGDFWNFGMGASNQVGFFGFKKDRTTNSTDWSATFNITSGAFYTTGSVTASGGFTGATFSGSGASLTSLNASNISSGTLAAARLATSGVTAGSYGPTANVSGSNGTTILVPQITVDTYGRVTSVTNRTYTSVNTDTNTDTKVTQTVSASNASYPILFSGSSSTNTSGAYFGTGVTMNPSTKTITATTFSGALSGNATTATTLATARTIQTNLASTSSASFNGSANITPGVTGTLPIANGGTGGTTAAAARANLGTMSAVSANGYYGMGLPDGSTSNWIRTTSNGIIPYQSGGSGSLGTSGWPFSTAYINTVTGSLSGNASSATRLATARTIALTGSVTGSGSFDGSGNLSITTTTNHTHNYAGSSSAGGAATSALSLSGRVSILSNSTATLPYHLFARVAATTSSYADSEAILVITQYYNGGKFGIVKLNQRTDNQSSAAAGASSATWLVRKGFAVDDIQVARYNTGTSSQTDFYLKTTNIYNRMNVYSITPLSGGFSLVSSSETDSNTGTYCYASVAAGGTALLSATYTSITGSADGAIVSYANSAGKLGTNAGSATQPVYFSNGVPVATTYTLGKSVPSNAVFTDTNTDTKVTQTVTTTNTSYPLLLAPSGQTATTTTSGYFGTKFQANPNTGVLTATTFSGALSGNATTATTATKVAMTSTNPTSSTSYYAPFSTGSGTTLLYNNGYGYVTLEGTASADGYGRIYLGNATASGTAGNKYGGLLMYGTDAYYWFISGAKAAAANRTIYMPNSSGSLVTATNATAVGGTAKPVYVSSAGAVTACSSTVGSATKPVYMSSGTITACSSTVGSASLPVYMSSGTITACTSGSVGLNAYPVGAVYISYVSTSPASLFGGTWTAITGRFPYFNAGTGTGGSNTHTLTVEQMPSHDHAFQTDWSGAGWQGDYSPMGFLTINNGADGNGGTLDAIYTTNIGVDIIHNSGGGGSHNNMPAYQTLYAWRRTA